MFILSAYIEKSRGLFGDKEDVVNMDCENVDDRVRSIHSYIHEILLLQEYATERKCVPLWGSLYNFICGRAEVIVLISLECAQKGKFPYDIPRFNLGLWGYFQPDNSIRWWPNDLLDSDRDLIKARNRMRKGKNVAAKRKRVKNPASPENDEIMYQPEVENDDNTADESYEDSEESQNMEHEEVMSDVFSDHAMDYDECVYGEGLCPMCSTPGIERVIGHFYGDCGMCNNELSGGENHKCHNVLYHGQLETMICGSCTVFIQYRPWSKKKRTQRISKSGL